MKFRILGSGGAVTTPKPLCSCSNCRKARTDSKLKRNSSSFYCEDIAALVDCGEDIADSLNRFNITDVEYLFITHWHPDHTFGLRPLLESNFDWEKGKPRKKIKIFIPRKVYGVLKERYPSITYLIDALKLGTVKHLEHNNSVNIGDVRVTAAGFGGKDADTFGYMFESNGKKLLYAPCDTYFLIQQISGLDILINECGLVNLELPNEISFKKLIERLRQWKPKKVILTHIEEPELKRLNFDKLRKQYSDLNLDFAYDGMRITL
ncbi:MBL fold metallo-hydrolase [Candidatus Woesearchaeota archaeon]|nr:MBL fold metallo-hydrolase [Candidatus Woesearchaeota archaeon]MBW3021411.1 MBL fold metallo-hydrolase [Candidatus Woesearchaeota archaeon]